MHVNNNGFVASNFTEESTNFKGTKQRTKRVKTKNTIDREKSVEMILQRSKMPGETLDRVLTMIFKRNENGLRAFVIGKGEIPDKNVLVVATQAALLRGDEIATIATAVDTDDNDALESIESAEFDAKENNSADQLPLNVETQAALSLLLDYAKKQNRKKGGDGSINDLVYRLRKLNAMKMQKASVNITSAFSGADNLTGFDFSQWGNTTTDTGTPVVGTTQPATTSGSGLTNTLNSIFSVFDKVISGVEKVGSTVNTTIGGVKNTASDIGSDSISKALKENAPKIIIGVVIFLIALYLIIKYGNKR